MKSKDLLRELAEKSKALDAAHENFMQARCNFEELEDDPDESDELAKAVEKAGSRLDFARMDFRASLARAEALIASDED